MAYPDPDSTAPDAALIEALALTAIAALPDAYRGPAQGIALRVVDFPTDEMLESLGIEDAFDLTGLYDGIPLTERSVMDQPDRPDAIWLFRRPILDEWAERGNVTLAELVCHVLVHELAHHFGWSDDDIASVDPWWQ
jgi:predicted Zn-dependent protease with MMP-like domain